MKINKRKISVQIKWCNKKFRMRETAAVTQQLYKEKHNKIKIISITRSKKNLHHLQNSYTTRNGIGYWASSLFLYNINCIHLSWAAKPLMGMYNIIDQTSSQHPTIEIKKLFIHGGHFSYPFFLIIRQWRCD